MVGKADDTVDPGRRWQRPAERIGGELVLDLREQAARTEFRFHREVALIIDAAWVVLDRSGWEGLKIDLVVSEAGLSIRTFYRHFRSKNELLVVLLEDEITRVSALAAQLARADLDPFDQVLAWIEGTVSLAHNPDTSGRTRLFLSLWWGLAREFPLDIEHCRSLLLTPLVEILEEGREQGQFPLAEPWSDATSILYLTIGRMGEFMNSAERTPVEAAALTEQFVRRALTGAPAVVS